MIENKTSPPKGSAEVIARIHRGRDIPVITVLRDRNHGDFTILISLPKGIEKRGISFDTVDDRIEILIETYPLENK